MTRALMMVAALALLASCGAGRDRMARNYGGAAINFAAGPIAEACVQSRRKAASRQLCGCVQGVADRSLSGSDQRLAVSFFADPHRAQEIRQSDNPRHESFWRRYKEFADTAERSCTGY